MTIDTKGGEPPDPTWDDLLDRLCDFVQKLDGEDKQQVLGALERAEAAHSGQKRDDGTPYITHPLRVALSLVHELDLCDPDLLCAALLHDALEDAKHLTLADIRKDFGERVAYIVDVLSKPNNRFLNHDQINRSYFRRLSRAGKDCKLVKLADKLDNVRDAVNSPDLAKQQRTAAEAKDFYLKLARSLLDVQRQQIILDLLQDAIRSVENQTAVD